MPEAARHAKPKSPARKLAGPSLAAAALAGIAAAFVFLPGSGPAQAAPDRTLSEPPAVTLPANRSDVTSNRLAATMHQTSAKLETRAAAARARAAAHRRHLAELAAQKRAQQEQQTPAPVSTPTTPPPSSPPPSSGTDAAHSALGICIRNAEQGGSYAWGPGNGGGAYQFLLSTWEHYGGAASEFGVAGPAYQDQIFDNAIAAGGASNWTNYDGC
jgi:Transglycosylase-like domain